MAAHPGHIYRPDIDGLCAVAVPFVVGYQAKPALVPGGFVGLACSS
jgi:peptidoglycan/LPS O-acetylase OafA/YrhL